MQYIPDYYNNLDKIYFKIWKLLNYGLQNRDAPFHIPIFICGNKNKPDGRIVVLRGINEKEMPITTSVHLETGDTLVMEAAGGGGYGDPSERDPEKRLEDFRQGYVTED